MPPGAVAAQVDALDEGIAAVNIDGTDGIMAILTIEIAVESQVPDHHIVG